MKPSVTRFISIYHQNFTVLNILVVEVYNFQVFFEAILCNL